LWADQWKDITNSWNPTVRQTNDEYYKYLYQLNIIGDLDMAVRYTKKG
jgi:hypothetical protein